jgi:hypothetical protein
VFLGLLDRVTNTSHPSYTQDVGGSRPSLLATTVNYPNSANSHLPHVARCCAGIRCPVGACLRHSKRLAVHRAGEHRPSESRRCASNADTQREASAGGFRKADVVGSGAMAFQRRAGPTGRHPTKQPAPHQAPALAVGEGPELPASPSRTPQSNCPHYLDLRMNTGQRTNSEICDLTPGRFSTSLFAS